MYILDTDTLTRLHAGHLKVVERLRDVADSRVVTTVVTKIELLQGRFESNRGSRPIVWQKH